MAEHQDVEDDSPTGWWNPTPLSSRGKFHYVAEDGRTLCGKWMYIGAGLVEEGHDDHSDNCAECKRKKAKRHGS